MFSCSNLNKNWVFLEIDSWSVGLKNEYTRVEHNSMLIHFAFSMTQSLRLIPQTIVTFSARRSWITSPGASENDDSWQLSSFHTQNIIRLSLSRSFVRRNEDYLQNTCHVFFRDLRTLYKLKTLEDRWRNFGRWYKVDDDNVDDDDVYLCTGARGRWGWSLVSGSGSQDHTLDTGKGPPWAGGDTWDSVTMQHWGCSMCPGHSRPTRSVSPKSCGCSLL